MLLLITNSEDATSDLLVDKIKPNIFRLNFDIANNYSITLTPDHWSIKSPTGHEISSDSVKSVFWWKSFSKNIETSDKYIAEEIKYIFREIYNWSKKKGIAKGNPYDFHNHLGKIQLLGIAKKYFSIPSTVVTIGSTPGVYFPELNEIVVKSLSSAQTNDKKTLISTLIEKNKLDSSYPWYAQELVNSDFDITVFICGHKRFFFSRSRSDLDGIDWRIKEVTTLDKKVWAKFVPTQNLINSVNSFCDEISVDWGRLDLMEESFGGEISFKFLEFNANGQFVFLDYTNEEGILSSVVEYLTID